MLIHAINNSSTPYFDMDEELALQAATKNLIQTNLINSAHDVSEGGLFTTLLEMAMAGGLGFKVDTDDSIRKDAFLFGESQSRIVVTVPQNREDLFISTLMKSDIDFSLLGEVKGQLVVIDDEKWGNVASWKETYDQALENVLNG